MDIELKFFLPIGMLFEYVYMRKVLNKYKYLIVLCPEFLIRQHFVAITKVFSCINKG